jgi:hypothetical protein
MRTIFYIIIIVLLLLLIGTFAILNKQYSYIRKYENARILKSVKISDIYDTLKSGDIILYKCNGLSISGLLSNIYYTHIGIVIKYDNANNANRLSDLYISETNPAFEYLPRDYKINNWYGLRPHIKKHQTGWKTNYGSDLLPLC